MSIVGFLSVRVGRGGHNSTTEAHSSQPILAKVLCVAKNIIYTREEWIVGEASS